MDKAKLQRKLEEQTVRDHTNMRNWRDRRKRRYDRIMNDPILPRFCTICFVCMLVGTSAMVVFDVYASLTYLAHLGIPHMLKNATFSAFFGWLIFAIPLVPCALYQLKKGFEEPYFKKMVLKKNGKPRMPLEKKFKMYVAVSAGGSAVLLVLYLLVQYLI